MADEFVERYGCPFLYAECRIFYGSVLAARGRWEDAERELAAGLHITDGACPALHDRALARLAGLRLRQGRLEEAEQLLSRLGGDVEAEEEAALWMAALHLARGDALAASRKLERRLDRLAEHRLHLAAALDLLVDAHLAAGDLDAAGAAADRLARAAAHAADDRLIASAMCAEGRVALARGDAAAAVARLEGALGTWSRLELPFELARTRYDLGRALASTAPDAAVEHGRGALAGIRGARRRARRRPGGRLPALARRVGAHRREGRRPVDGARAGGARVCSAPGCRTRRSRGGCT